MECYIGFVGNQDTRYRGFAYVQELGSVLQELVNRVRPGLPQSLMELRYLLRWEAVSNQFAVKLLVRVLQTFYDGEE